MNTCCPNCSSTSAIGNDAASACAECLNVSVAGTSMPVGAIVTASLIAGVVLVAMKVHRHRGASWGGWCRRPMLE